MSLFFASTIFYQLDWWCASAELEICERTVLTPTVPAISKRFFSTELRTSQRSCDFGRSLSVPSIRSWLNFYDFAHAGKDRCQSELPMSKIGECSPRAIFAMNQNDSRPTGSDVTEPMQ